MSFYDPYSDEVLENPQPIYARLRAEAPVLYLEEYDTWFLARFEDVWRSTQSPSFSVAQGMTPSNLLLGTPANTRMPSQKDPPRHTEIRRLVGPHFRPSAAAALESDAREIAGELLEALLPRGGFDVARDFAGPLASRIACRLTGLPEAEAPRFRAWIDGFFHRSPDRRGETEKAEQAAKEFEGYVSNWVREARADSEARQGVAQTLLTRPAGAAPLDDDHVIQALINFLIAASDTFPKAFSAAVHRLWRHPEERARLARDPSLAANAFNEAVRIDHPTQFQGRTLLDDYAIGPHRLQRGQKVCFLFPSANRDESEFEAADSYRIERRPPRTLGFGNGTHLCLGMHVARMEARIALTALLEAVSDYHIDEKACRRARTEYVQGWLELPIEFAPAH